MNYLNNEHNNPFDCELMCYMFEAIKSYIHIMKKVLFQLNE